MFNFLTDFIDGVIPKRNAGILERSTGHEEGKKKQTDGPNTIQKAIELSAKMHLKLFDRMSQVQQVHAASDVRLFALVIGINVYIDVNITNLRGAVADSHSMKDFLISVVGVPLDHIQHLTDHEATSDAIKLAISAFAKNDKIHHGDSILIYYAGHGSEANAPDSWPQQERNKVQMILPHDFVLGGQDSARGQGLIDRTFSVLLHKVAKAKGDNITVILDSCHSGSGTRDTPHDSTTLSRSVELPANYKIYPRIDQEIVSTVDEQFRSAIVATNFAQTGLTSHVLLAACREEEKARESNGRGIFTQALLDTLRLVGFDKITYRDLILRLPDLAREQHPQCEGVHRTRFIFNSLVSSPRKTFYPVDIEPSNRYIIRAGEAHGISAGAEFAIYKSLDSGPLGKLYVRSGTAFTSLLRSRDEPPLVLTHPSFAVETRRGDNEPAVRILVQPNFPEDLGLTQEERERFDQGLKGVMFVEAREGADLALLLDQDFIGFEILDKACVDHGLTHTRRRPRQSNEDILLVLLGASHFYYHLRRSNKAGIIGSKVALECTRLIDTSDSDGFPITMPDGENLNRDGLITILVDDDDLELPPYGYRITNNPRNFSLYVSVFYFDNSNLSITAYYQPFISRTMAPSLLPGGSITIGYGSSGTAAYSFELSEGQNLDVGFIKLFVSTEHVDCSAVEQCSPFDDGTRSIVPTKSRHALWDSSIVTVVQKRKGVA